MSSAPAWSYRPAHEAEAQTIAEFQVRNAWETESMKLDPETVLRGVRAVFEVPARGTYFVGTHPTSGEIGVVTLVLPEWSDWRAGTVWWIHSVYVLEPFRRLGLFRGMYQMLRAEVERRSDLRGLRLYVDRTNLNAQKTYQALGMNPDHYILYEWMKG